MTTLTSLSEIDNVLNAAGFTTCIDDNEYGASVSVKVNIGKSINYIKVIDIEDTPISRPELINKANEATNDFIASSKRLKKELNGRTEINMNEALKIF